MPKVRIDEHNRLTLPAEFLQLRDLAPGTEYWLEGREGDLIFHPRLPDVRKIYIEPTTSCNLRCSICIRNVWEDPEAEMSMDTFQRLTEGLELSLIHI